MRKYNDKSEFEEIQMQFDNLQKLVRNSIKQKGVELIRRELEYIKEINQNKTVFEKLTVSNIVWIYNKEILKSSKKQIKKNDSNNECLF